MFRDREKELDRLNRQLLEEDEEEQEAADEEQVEEPEEEQPDYDAYNGDTTDVDLEDYSDRVYEEPPSRKALVAVVLLVTAAVLVFLAYLLAKKEGLI